MLILIAACGSEAPSKESPPATAPVAAPAPVPSKPAGPRPTEGTATYGLRGVDYSCAPCGDLLHQMGVDVRAKASSTLKEKYAAGNVIGSELSKAWCEGRDGPGVGETLRIDFGRPLHLDGVAVYGGFFKSADLLAANGRVKALRLTSDDGTDELVKLADPAEPLKTDPSTQLPIDDWWTHLLAAEPPWHRTAHETDSPATWVQLEILEVYPGSKYTDTCISRVDVMTIDPEELD